MNRLSAIPIRIESRSQAISAASGLSPAVLAVLHEIEELLVGYQAFGRNGSIDLRWMSLLPGDIERIADVLGDGEVCATVNALGCSIVRETAVQCVWWVEHRGPAGEALGRWIEVTEVPSSLRSDRASIAFGLEELRDRIESFSGRTT